MKDGTSRLTCLGVDHRADHRVREQVAPISDITAWTCFALRLLEQVAVQRFVQGSETVLFCEIGHPAQVFKSDTLVENGSCYQQRRGVGCETIESCHDDFAHTGWEEPRYY